VNRAHWPVLAAGAVSTVGSRPRGRWRACGVPGRRTRHRRNAGSPLRRGRVARWLPWPMVPAGTPAGFRWSCSASTCRSWPTQVCTDADPNAGVGRCRSARPAGRRTGHRPGARRAQPARAGPRAVPDRCWTPWTHTSPPVEWPPSQRNACTYRCAPSPTASTGSGH